MTKKFSPAKSPVTSQTLARGLDVIEAVMTSGKSISEIASETGMTYSTAHRIISVLVDRGYLKVVAENKLILGAKIIEVGFQAYHQLDLVKIAKPHLERLARETSDTVHLARLEGSHVIYLEKIPSLRPIEIRSSIGGLRPAITTGVGKALMLDWNAEDLKAAYAEGHDNLVSSISSQDWVKQALEFSRDQYAFDLGDSETEIRCVAAPVRDATGKIVAAISVTSTFKYMPATRMQELIPIIKTAALEISKELGFNGRE